MCKDRVHLASYICMMQRLIYLLLATLVSSCAIKVAPTGGAGDKVPPAVEAFEPSNGSTNVRPSSVVVLFNKYVDPNVRSVVIVQPEVPYRVSYAGNEIAIDFQRELDSSTTYSVTIGANYTDTHNNRPERSATLVFSTGVLIDTGSISGTVKSASTDGLVVFCYKIDGMQADTLNPAHTSPRYRMPVGTSGAFTVSGLHDGLYRLIAVADVNKNSLLDPNEEYAMPTSDTRVEAGVARVVMLRVGPALDVFKPYLVRSRSTSTRTIVATMSENVDSSALSPSSFVVRDSTRGTVVPLRSVSISPDARDRVVLHTIEPLASGTYLIRCDSSSVRDSAGNVAADTGASIRFAASTTPDTTRLRIVSVSMPDSARKVNTPVVFDVRFSDAVDSSSSGWISPTIYRYHHISTTKPGTWDSLALPLRGLRSVLGSVMRDTVLVRRFATSERSDPGTVTGTLTDSLHAGGPFLLRIVSAKDSIVATTVLQGSGEWTIENVPEGTYTMDVVLDVNRNGRYDHGGQHPYRPSEFIWTVTTPLRVRARWTVDGVAILLKQD